MYVPPQALSCICSACSEGNCYIDLRGRSKITHVLNLTCLKGRMRRAGNIADCAILWKGRSIFSVIELKGGLSHVGASLVAKQIQAGVDLIAELICDQHVTDFFPILLYRGRDPTTSMRRKLIVFRGQKRRIIIRPCGTRLGSVV